MKKIIFACIILFSMISFQSCKNDPNEEAENKIIALWQLDEKTADDVQVPLTSSEKEIKLLIEPNGIYRNSNATSGTHKVYDGTWIITEGKWIDFTADRWKYTIKKDNTIQWDNFHVPYRFTILSLTDNELKIRIKTYIYEQKYALLFSENARPTDASSAAVGEQLFNESRTMSTYIYTFKKVKY